MVWPRCAIAIGAPSLSKRMQRVLVVPWSMAATNLAVIAQPFSEVTNPTSAWEYLVERFDLWQVANAGDLHQLGVLEGSCGSSAQYGVVAECRAHVFRSPARERGAISLADDQQRPGGYQWKLVGNRLREDHVRRQRGVPRRNTLS
jgi:hypothetical protein